VLSCYPDARKLCGTTNPVRSLTSVQKVLVGTCLFAHMTELSPKCRAVFQAHGL
jgi:hypothetical protein